MMRLLQIASFIALSTASFGATTEAVMANLDQSSGKFQTLTANLTHLT
ncbi:MAG TPA: hypothetical protein VER03_21985 [Bryobacteraceae bacterium]|nr:hypothetical protein [Bryobacteraceae bacterium]